MQDYSYKHDQCQCEIRYHQFRGRGKLTPGLFCQQHDLFLDWLTDNMADQLIQDGIPVAEYRKKPKPIDITDIF